MSGVMIVLMIMVMTIVMAMVRNMMITIVMVMKMMALGDYGGGGCDHDAKGDGCDEK